MVERWEAKKRDLEEAQLRRTFDGVDEDGSGEIEPPEFKRLCRRLDARLSDEVVAEAWRQIDEDGSGSADFREFEMWWNSQNGRELRGVQDEEAPKWSYKQLLAAVRPRPALPEIPGSERLKVVGGWWVRWRSVRRSGRRRQRWPRPPAQSGWPSTAPPEGSAPKPLLAPQCEPRDFKNQRETDAGLFRGLEIQAKFLFWCV